MSAINLFYVYGKESYKLWFSMFVGWIEFVLLVFVKARMVSFSPRRNLRKGLILSSLPTDFMKILISKESFDFRLQQVTDECFGPLIELLEALHLVTSCGYRLRELVKS